jgi:tetratricopeptide (TPR) repeat protein
MPPPRGKVGTPLRGVRLPLRGVHLLAAVFALKAALALTLAAHPLLQPVGELDSGEYWRLAQRVAGGDLWLQGTPFYVSPLYIYVLAMLQTLAGGSLLGVLLLQAALGTAAAGLVARCALHWSTPAAGIVAATLVTLTGVVALQEATILQSAIDPLLAAVFLVAFTIALQGGTWRAWFWCGIALAFFGLNRPNAWLLAGLCLPAAIVRDAARPRAAAAFAVGALVALAPFTVRTAVATGEWQLLPGHGGLNFYVGNHAGATGTYTVVDGIRPSIDGQREDTRRVAESARGRPLTDGDVSTYFVRRAVDWWLTQPASALSLTAYKAWLVVHAWELPVNVSYAWFREQVPLLWTLPVGAWLLLPLTAAALLARPLGVVPDGHSAWRWFRLVVPVYLASVVVVFVVDRYRAPSLVMAAVVVAPALAAMITARLRLSTPARRDWVAVAAGLALLAAAIVPLPFDLGQGEADTRMALHAIAGDRDDEARAWLARADGRRPPPGGVAYFRAGLAWQSQAKWPEAEWALREARRLDPDVPDVAFALAGALLSQGKGAEAVPLLEEADRRGVRPDRVRLDLALGLWQTGREAEARAVVDGGIPEAGLPLLRARALAAVDARQPQLAAWLLGAYRARTPDDAEVAEKLGLMLATQGRLDEAALQLAAAAGLEPGRATARFNLALVRLQQGRRDEAMALLREALRIDPGYVQAAGALREIGG